MELRQLTLAEAVDKSVANLGFEPGYVDFSVPEVLAEQVRRFASVLAPCTPATLRVAVTEAVEMLVDEAFPLRDLVDETIEQILAHGDLVEASAQTDDQRVQTRLLYLAPPSFVVRDSGDVLLLGVAPDGAPYLPESLTQRIEFERYLRWVRETGDERLADVLPDHGLVELTRSQWLRFPRERPASALLEHVNALLALRAPAEGSSDVRLLDSMTGIGHYRSRWTPLRGQTGRFVARRPQSYGSDLWCYVEVTEGSVVHLLDLPLAESQSRGCDDAWWIQAAIDASLGQPHVVRVRPIPTDRKRAALDFAQPIPRWSQRALELVGQPTTGRSLFSFGVADSDLDEEAQHLERQLWIQIDRTSYDR